MDVQSLSPFGWRGLRSTLIRVIFLIMVSLVSSDTYNADGSEWILVTDNEKFLSDVRLNGHVTLWTSHDYAQFYGPIVTAIYYLFQNPIQNIFSDFLCSHLYFRSREEHLQPQQPVVA